MVQTFTEMLVCKGYKGLKVPDAHPYPRLYRSGPLLPPATRTSYLHHEFSDSRCDTVCIWYNDNFSKGDGTKIKSNMIQIGDIYKFSTMNLFPLSTLFSHIVQMMMEEGYS